MKREYPFFLMTFCSCYFKSQLSQVKNSGHGTIKSFCCCYYSKWIVAAATAAAVVLKVKRKITKCIFWMPLFVVRFFLKSKKDELAFVCWDSRYIYFFVLNAYMQENIQRRITTAIFYVTKKNVAQSNIATVYVSRFIYFG